MPSLRCKTGKRKCRTGVCGTKKMKKQGTRRCKSGSRRCANTRCYRKKL